MQQNIILFSAQILSNWGIKWLPWPSKISSLNRLYIREFVDGINSFCSQCRPILSVVQLLLEISNYQSFGRLSNQSAIATLSLKITYGDSKKPSAQIVSIAVIHSQFPGCRIDRRL